MLGRTVVVFFSTAVVFTSLLFFFRTRAVFKGNQWIVAFFATLWLAVLGGCSAFVVDVFYAPSPAPNTHTFCVNENINPFVAAATIIPLISDTLTFLAVTWRLFHRSYVRHTLKNGIRLFVFGDYLPVFSKTLLQDGQAYYLLALSCCLMLKHLTGCSFHRTITTINLFAVIMLFDHSMTNIQILRTMFTVPNVALMNIMACRVHRNLVLFRDSREIEIYTTL